jgi:hypothetical protein
MVRDNGRTSLELFEKRLAERKGLKIASNLQLKNQKNFIEINRVPKRHFKITQGSKDIVLDSY